MLRDNAIDIVIQNHSDVVEFFGKFDSIVDKPDMNKLVESIKKLTM